MLFNELGVSALTMITLDSIYLQIVQNAYYNQLLQIQGSPLSIKLIPAILCYVLLVFGLNYFIISKKRSVVDAFLLGLVIYGVYDTTTYALITKWSPYLALTDAIWGGILMAITTYITYHFVA